MTAEEVRLRIAQGEDSRERDIAALVRFGEDTTLEFKRVVFQGSRIVGPDRRDIADEISAMANTASGRVVFGVDDKTRTLLPLTISELDLLETWIGSICADLIDPPLNCLVRKVPVADDRGVIVVDVPRSVFVHKGAHGYFTRIGSAKRELSPEALARLFQQKSQTRIVCFDEQVMADAEVSELQPALYRAYRTSLSSPDDQEFLRKMHFVARDDRGCLKPTVGGLLMASDRPDRFLPSAFIQAVAYRGTERTADAQLDARDIYGPLNVQVVEALRFVNRNMRVRAVKRPGRVDIPQFSLSAVFEAIVNAVAHRDYSIAGSKIRLHMFSDRLELFSPGGLPNALTLEEMSERQFSRNELLCSALSRCAITESVQGVSRMTMMDRRGEGVPIILEEGMKIANKPPKYEILDDSEVKLTLFSALDIAEETCKTTAVGGVKVENGGVNDAIGGVKTENGGVKAKNGGVKDLADDLLRIIRQNPGLRVPDLVKLTGATRRTVERHLKSRLSTLVEFRGAPKNGGYHCI